MEREGLFPGATQQKGGRQACDSVIVSRANPSCPPLPFVDHVRLQFVHSLETLSHSLVLWSYLKESVGRHLECWWRHYIININAERSRGCRGRFPMSVGRKCSTVHIAFLAVSEGEHVHCIVCVSVCTLFWLNVALDHREANYLFY